MGKFKPYRNKQPMFLPPSIEDYVPSSHLARVVDGVVEVLDTKDIEDKYSDLGQNTYHPKIMLKLLFYGYATGNRSGRKIARLCETDTGYMYLAQMYRPDFRTINDFRKDNLVLIKRYFVAIIRLCKELGMVKVGQVSIDGTKIKANAANRRMKNRKDYEQWLKRIDQEIEQMLQDAAAIEEAEDRQYGKDQRGDELPEKINTKERLREKIKEVVKTLDTEKEKKNLTDPDARFMKGGNGQIDVNYNGQIAVSEDQVIMAAEVISEPNDREALISTLEQTEANIREEIAEVVADAGYSSYDNYEYLKKRGKIGYIPDQYWEKKKHGEYEQEANRYHPENFVYDKEKDMCLCPEGKELKRYKGRHSKKGVRKRRQTIYKGVVCGGCKVRHLCTKQEARTLAREERRELLEEMRGRLSSAAGKEKYKKRLHTAESPFGHLKHNLGYRSFLLRGLKKVGGEFTLMCIGYNLKKIQAFLTPRSEDKQKGILHGKLGISICDIPRVSFLIRVIKRFIFDFLYLSASGA